MSMIRRKVVIDEIGCMLNGYDQETLEAIHNALKRIQADNSEKKLADKFVRFFCMWF